MRKQFILLSAGLALLVAFALGACASKSKDADISDENIAYFTISDEHCVLEHGTRLGIYGTLTNNSDVPVSHLTIRYNIYGDDGKVTRDPGLEPADEWESYILPLNPGESVEFRVSGEISDRTNGVASFEFEYFHCSFDEKTKYKKSEVSGYVTREESEALVAAAIKASR